MYPYVIFDLDGTLLNTIDDLANAGNHVCRLHGWPTHSVDEFKRMVGNGIPKLVERFAPEGTGAPVLEQALGEFMAWYGVHKADQTAPYPGMLQAVRRLKEAGVSIAVLSNKADEMAGPVVEGYYPQIFPLVQGALTGIPTKPDPTLLHRLMERMGASQENTLFVGDSNVDIQTAKNGGLTSCGVLWGFRSRQELEQEGADYLASTPEDLLTLILGEKGGRETRHLGPEDVEEAAAILRSGGLVGIPTETVYGLGANALDEAAARKIYEAKGRPSDNPLIAHVADPEDVEALVEYIPENGRKLMEAFWPGPLTMIFPKSPAVPYGTTGGLDTVAIRMPSDPVANRLIALAGVPVAAPSANTSGRPSPTTADHVWQDMNGRIDMIIDGGPVGIGVESTIVDVSCRIPTVLRPGAITMEMLREVLDEVKIDPAILGPMGADMRPRAPGMKYKHYAPRAELTLVEPTEGQGEDAAAVERMIQRVNRLAQEKLAAGSRVGIICTDESRDRYEGGLVRSIGARAKKETVAHNLYAVLREFDDLKVDYIYSESFSEDHLGQAIMNRLSKAAGYHIERV